MTVNGTKIPFRMEFSGTGDTIRGFFFNGDEKLKSTSGRFYHGTLVLNFDYYLGRLEARLRDGRLEGTYARPARVYPFEAKRFVAVAQQRNPPQIAGLWEIAVKSSKGESAWRMVVRQNGAEVSAAILRVDGDTGVLSGTWRDGKLALSHFSGARPALVKITPRSDGSLDLALDGETLMARRPAEARAKGLAKPTDPALHTRMKDPEERFHFAFPDLTGRILSDTDTRFRNKVMIVSIGGSWCPNCHDEAPFLMELYRKYRALGLEIVGLAFEEEEQLKNPARLRAFINRYGIEYPMLLAGQTEELNAKIPQAENLNSWPTSFFLGRDGKVRTIHAGFAGRATGDFHNQLRAEVTALVERLLAENAISER